MFSFFYIKANANNHKFRNELIKRSARFYEKELRKEITSERTMHGKKPLKERKMGPLVKDCKTSTNDPKSRLFRKGEHKKVFADAKEKHGMGYTQYCVIDKFGKL